MVWSIPVAIRPEHPTNILNKYAGNRLLAALPEQPIALLAPDLRQVTLPQGVVCYGTGDPIDQVYFPRGYEFGNASKRNIARAGWQRPRCGGSGHDRGHTFASRCNGACRIVPQLDHL